MPIELATKEVTQLICELTESALRQRGLLMRPIPFFARFDWLRAREEELMQTDQRYLSQLNEAITRRIVHAGACADMLSRDLLRNFNPSFFEEGEFAHRTLWGTAIIIDQLLDEDRMETASLASVLKWVGGQARDGISPDSGKIHAINPTLNALVSMLADIITDCRTRAVDVRSYATFSANLSYMLDAELASVDVSLDALPGKQVRTIVRDKSILLSWAGFLAYSIGQTFDTTATRDYQNICEAVGEVLWIMDDLMDLEEDLDRGIWNRTLWQLYDTAGRVRFREMTTSKVRLAEGIIRQDIIAREIDEIAQRVEFLETHPRIKDPEKIRAMLSFWLTAWLGIYT